MFPKSAKTTTFAGKSPANVSQIRQNDNKRQEKYTAFVVRRSRNDNICRKKSPANVSEFSARKRCSAAL